MVDLLLAGLLFASLLALFLLLLVPGEYSSPAAVTVDGIARYVNRRLISEEARSKLDITGRREDDIVKMALLAGLFLGLAGFLFSVWSLHWLAVPIAAALFVLGLLLVRFVTDNEFRRWQGRALDAVPDLVSFVPAFLKTGAITLRGAISMTLPFLAGPLQDELWAAIDKVKRTGNARQAFGELSDRIAHPCVDAICVRLSASWDATPEADMFDDLYDQIRDVEEIAAARATAGKTGLLALICVLGLLGAMLVFGYPALVYMLGSLTRTFGS